MRRGEMKIEHGDGEMDWHQDLADFVLRRCRAPRR